MIGKINKKILLLAVVALLAISAACLLANPVKQAKAEETTLTVTFIRGNDSLEIKKITGVRSGTEVKDLDISDIASTYDGAEIGYFANNLALPSQSLGAMKSLRYPITGDTTFYVYYKTSVNVFVNGNGMVMGRIIAAYDETLKNLDFSAVHYTEHGYDRIDFPTELGGLAEKHVYEMFGATISVGDPITITFTDGETNETLKIVRIPKNSAGTIGKSCGLTNADFVKSGKVFDKATLLPFKYDFKDISACGYPSDGSYTFKVYFKDAPVVNKHTVTFKNDSGVLKTATVNYGAKANEIDLAGVNTAKTGYTFKGWSKTDGGAVVNLANETITADTTYYAVYEINKHTVTFKNDSNVLKTATVNYGAKADTIDLTDINTAKTGYTFKGWSKTDGGEVVDLSAITITQSMALFASYKKQTFEVKFYDGETQLKTATVDYGTNLSAISLTGVTTDKAGFTFRGWALSNGGAVVNLETYSVKSAVNLYAVYDVDGKATVVFKDGVTSLKTVTVDLGAKASEIDVSDLELEKSGYTFKGWARSENGIIVDLETVSVNEYTVLYAVYEKNAVKNSVSSDDIGKVLGVVGLVVLVVVVGKLFFKKRR